MLNDGYCAVYVDARQGAREFRLWLAEILDGSVVGFTIETSVLTIDVEENDTSDPERAKRGGDGFLYFPLFLDILPQKLVEQTQYVEGVAKLLHTLWAQDLEAVAACDFEEDLPRKGDN